MPVKPEELKAALLEKTVAHVHERFDDAQAGLIERFVRAYYARRRPRGSRRSQRCRPVRRRARALGACADGGSAGEIKVHVYNPTAEEDGWESPHTVVEFVNDDMPFLVDSISMAITRDGSGIHLLIRPIVRVRARRRRPARDVLGRRGEAWPESTIHVEIDRQTDRRMLDELASDLLRVLGDVQAAVEDWPAMRERAHEMP